VSRDISKSNLEDQNRLKMERLLFLIDKAVVPKTTALEITRALVLGQGLLPNRFDTSL
jgi:hypothetical protein